MFFFLKITSYINNNFTKESNLRLHNHAQKEKSKQQLEPSQATPVKKEYFPNSHSTSQCHIDGNYTTFLFHGTKKSLTIDVKTGNGKCIITI